MHETAPLGQRFFGFEVFRLGPWRYPGPVWCYCALRCGRNLRRLLFAARVRGLGFRWRVFRLLAIEGGVSCRSYLSDNSAGIYFFDCFSFDRIGLRLFLELRDVREWTVDGVNEILRGYVSLP